ncbi:MAG: nitrile hydratase subunit alpha [Paracoccaceae bacterium]
MPTFDSDAAAEVHRHLHTALPSDPALRVKALESLVIERGLVAAETLDAWVEAYSDEIGPKRGAQVVARSWTDPAFRERLLADGTEAIREFGFEGDATGHLKAVENTATAHNLVVCTLCSCYPFSILGMSPSWHKSAAYRSRAVREPRAVLKEFGVSLAPDVAVNVWDSTAELRYLVVPQRPAGTEHFSDRQLAALVTRNSMIGTDRDLAVPPGGPA